ncbi:MULTISPECIES: alpha/beta hydrolase [unclassified Nonomuraea]|uniref:alpha/beta hydrolase n=1 Tax=unclassified Nonomuraea TaxID=2593643 RepID=UPI00340AB538
MDPELAVAARSWVRRDLADLDDARRVSADFSDSVAGRDFGRRVKTTEILIAGPGSDLVLRVYTPHEAVRPLPGLLFVHGGAFVMGDLESEHYRCLILAEEAQVVVVSVDYRLAPEHPFPAGFDDVYAALCWVAAHAQSLDIDPSRIGIGGSSAGAALSAAVALAARDRGGPTLKFQLLIYPVTDDRMVTASMARFTHTPGWDSRNSVTMWQMYLGDHSDDVSPYAAPARAASLKHLPPAYIFAADNDPMRDEAIEFARRLIDADVPTELHYVPGTFHAFELEVPEAEVSRRAYAEQARATSTWLRA